MQSYATFFYLIFSVCIENIMFHPNANNLQGFKMIYSNYYFKTNVCIINAYDSIEHHVYSVKLF